MTNYQITIGYKAVLQLNIKAVDEKEAEKLALLAMHKMQERAANRTVEISDSNYKVDGILNMDETWNMVQN